MKPSAFAPRSTYTPLRSTRLTIPLTSVLKTDRKWLRAQPLGEAAG